MMAKNKGSDANQDYVLMVMTETQQVNALQKKRSLIRRIMSIELKTTNQLELHLCLS